MLIIHVCFFPDVSNADVQAHSSPCLLIGACQTPVSKVFEVLENFIFD